MFFGCLQLVELGQPFGVDCRRRRIVAACRIPFPVVLHELQTTALGMRGDWSASDSLRKCTYCTKRILLEKVIRIGIFDGVLGLGIASEIAPLVSYVQDNFVSLGLEFGALSGLIGFGG